MIKSITLRNWKSFGEATLYVDPLTVLIGTNASGKSNFLDALVFLREFAAGRTVSEAFTGIGNGYAGIRGGGDLVIRDGCDAAKISVEVTQSVSENNSFRYDLTIMRSDEFDYILSEESLYDVTAEKEVELFSFKKQIHSVLEIDVKRYYYLGTEPEDVKQRIEMALDLLTLDLKRIQVLDPIPQNMRAFSRLSRSLMSDGANLAGFLCNHVNKDEIERKLSEVLTNFPENEITKCWAQSVGLLGKDAMLYCHEKWPGKKKPLLIDANGLSDGTLRLLAILTALLSAEPGTTIAIEEIDNGLHPSRAKLLVNLLHKIGTERGIDIICTTHNPALLDAFGLSMLPFIALVYRDPENGTSQIKNLDEIKNYERIITKGSLGDLITKGRFEGALKAH